MRPTFTSVLGPVWSGTAWVPATAGMRPTFTSVLGAVITLSNPLVFGGAMAEANRLLSRCRQIVCSRCDETGTTPGIRKRRCRCRRCLGQKRGYTYGQAIYWTGWPAGEETAQRKLTPRMERIHG
jgi:hypothetical protein